MYCIYLSALTALELNQRDGGETIEGPTSGHEMHQQALGQQHLPAAQHASPAAVRGETGALQLGELPPVGQPQPGHEHRLETLHLVWGTEGRITGESSLEQCA